LYCNNFQCKPPSFSALSAPLREKNISGAIRFIAGIIFVIVIVPLRAFPVNGFQTNPHLLVPQHLGQDLQDEQDFPLPQKQDMILCILLICLPLVASWSELPVCRFKRILSTDLNITVNYCIATTSNANPLLSLRSLRLCAKKTSVGPSDSLQGSFILSEKRLFQALRGCPLSRLERSLCARFP
jgi:hypothetical protein